MKRTVKVEDMSQPAEPLIEIQGSDLMPLPVVSDADIQNPTLKGLTEEQKRQYEGSLDGFIAIGIPRPQNAEEEEEFIKKFLAGLEKLFLRENNWTFLQPLIHSLDYCVKCQLCSDSCPVFVATGGKEIYRPTFRPELLRRIINKYLKKRGNFLNKMTRSDIDLNFSVIARLAELAYRCTLCRRCTQVCPMGVDNALISREIRKLFSQEGPSNNKTFASETDQ